MSFSFPLGPYYSCVFMWAVVWLSDIPWISHSQQADEVSVCWIHQHYHQCLSENQHTVDSGDDDIYDGDVYMLWALSCHYSKVNRHTNKGIFYTCVVPNPEALAMCYSTLCCYDKITETTVTFQMGWFRSEIKHHDRHRGAKLLIP